MAQFDVPEQRCFTRVDNGKYTNTKREKTIASDVVEERVQQKSCVRHIDQNSRQFIFCHQPNLDGSAYTRVYSIAFVYVQQLNWRFFLV